MQCHFSVFGRASFSSAGMISKVLCSYLTVINFHTKFNSTMWGEKKRRNTSVKYSLADNVTMCRQLQKLLGADSDLNWCVLTTLCG